MRETLDEATLEIQEFPARNRGIFGSNRRPGIERLAGDALWSRNRCLRDSG